jgi:catechol 2,3-dioxygenase-like lactoylglutathione lyase family enzyme
MTNVHVHVHVHVSNLEASVSFYERFLGAAPVETRHAAFPDR